MLGSSQVTTGGFDFGTVTSSDIQHTSLGTGNIAMDPLFVDPANGNFRLQTGSPCIDQASDVSFSGYDADLDGKPLKLGTPPHGDMGAYEQ